MAGLIRQADVDEVKARTNIADIIGERVALNLSTNTLETARMGHDYRDILQERARERRMEEDYGVPVARKEPTAGPVEHASDEEAKGKAT